jgi:hexosaminidase
LTDTQSWPIEIEGFPLLTQWLAYGNKKFDTAANGTTSHIYTMKEMGALVDYCLDRAVRVIPEVDMPGHLVAQHAYPSYFAPQDNPHGCGTNANMTCERGLIDVTTSHGFEFIEGIWKSLIATFPGGEYHLGGDEVWSVP